MMSWVMNWVHHSIFTSPIIQWIHTYIILYLHILHNYYWQQSKNTHWYVKVWFSHWLNSKNYFINPRFSKDIRFSFVSKHVHLTSNPIVKNIKHQIIVFNGLKDSFMISESKMTSLRSSPVKTVTLNSLIQIATGIGVFVIFIQIQRKIYHKGKREISFLFHRHGAVF